MYTWPSKDPDEVLDYSVDWTSRLAIGETITTSQFIIEQGDVTIKSENPVDGPVTTAWLSGGTNGTVSVLTNRITTSAGRTYDETARLRVRSTANG